MADVYRDDQLTQQLDELGSGWSGDSEGITKTFELPSFPAAIEFVTQLAEHAEDQNHHPDIDIRYRKVSVALSTHSAGGVTEKDITLARSAEGVASRIG